MPTTNALPAAAVSAVLAFGLVVPLAPGTAVAADVGDGSLVTEDFRPGVERIISDGKGNDFSRVAQVAVDADGDVWTLSGETITRLGGQTYGSADGTPEGASELVAGRGGHLVAYGSDAISTFVDGEWTSLPKPAGEIRQAIMARDGRPWITLWLPDRPLARLDGGEWTYLSLREVGFDPDAPAGGGYPGISAIVETPDGSIWIGSDVYANPPLRRFDGETWQPEQPFTESLPAATYTMDVDADGALWATLWGLEAVEQLGLENQVQARWDGDGWSVSDGGRHHIAAIGPDGRTWSIHYTGRLRATSDDGAWTDLGFPAREGYRDPEAVDLALGPDGSAWVAVAHGGRKRPVDLGTPAGLYRIAPDISRVEPVPLPDRILTTGPGDGMTVREAVPGVWRVIDDGAGGEPTNVRQVAVTDDGAIWVATDDGVRRLGTAEAYGRVDGLPASITSLQVASDGSLIAHDGRRVVAFDGKAWRTITKRSPHPIIEVDRIRNGAVWAGVDARDELVGRYRRGKWTWFGAEDIGFRPSRVRGRGAVRGVAQTGDGLVWVGTTDGLATFDGKRWQIRRSAIPRLRAILGLAVDPSGFLWFTVVDSRTGKRALGHRLCTDCRRWGFLEISDDTPAYRGARTGRITIGPDGVIWFGVGEAAGVVRRGLLRHQPVGDAWPDGLATDGDIGETDIAIGPDGSAWIATSQGLYLIESPRNPVSIATRSAELR